MPEILIKHGTPIVWANVGTYSSTVSGFVRTDQIDLNTIFPAAARQGAKTDLEHLAPDKFPARWLVTVGIEFNPGPTNGTTVDFYWAGSSNSLSSSANPGGTIGFDAAYTGTSGGGLTASLLQLQYIGSLIVTTDATPVVHYQTIGVLTAVHRYGMPVVVNNTNVGFMNDTVEQFVALIPLIDEGQV